MLKKVNSALKIFILIIFIIALIYFIGANIYNFFNGLQKKDKDKIDISNIDSYITKTESDLQDKDENVVNEELIVKDYSTYYTLQGALTKFIGIVSGDKYQESYDTLSQEMKDKYSKKVYIEKIEKFRNSHILNSDKTGNFNKLDIAYKIKDSNRYLCDFMSKKDEKIRVGIRLNSNNTYEVFYIDFKE